MGKWFRRLLGAGFLAAFGYAVWRLLDERQRTGPIAWEPQPFPSPPRPVPNEAAGDVVWREPDGDVCPTSHPVKAKLASGIFHLPGGQMYERTVPDRCYPDATTAEADGLRASKR